MDWVLALIPLLPLLGSLAIVLGGRRLPAAAPGIIATVSVAASAAVALLLLPHAAGEGIRSRLFVWLSSEGFAAPFGLVLDPLSAPMAAMVTVVSALIHLYAAGYMREDPGRVRFFALFNLFVFAMLIIVLADNLALLFLGWEGVGFCSYALIGFWFREPKNAAAGQKAFLVTRVGDVFLLVAVLWLLSRLGTTDIVAINAAAPSLPAAGATAVGVLLLLGAAGKSAQLPLMTWLPDAMAGPTPVSALIHAATMVTAGAYLLCRLNPLLSQSPAAAAAVAAVGALTALYAALCALFQREIKRVLAYSTMSQVGYMLLAAGAGAVGASLFHLIVHAFFKALLFMAAGVIIHRFGGENDITRMGGLRREQRALFYLFVAGALCLAGAPLTGGFFSKDAILLSVLERGGGFYRLLFGVAIATALITAVYTFRLLYLVFLGERRSPPPAHPHAIGRSMMVPLWPLAALGLLGGLGNLPGGGWLDGWLAPVAQPPPPASHAAEWALAAAAALMVLAGWALAHRRYRGAAAAAETGLARAFRLGLFADEVVRAALVRPFHALARFSRDWVDDRIIDGGLRGAARGFGGIGAWLSRLANGSLLRYRTALGLGLLGLLAFAVAVVWRP